MSGLLPPTLAPDPPTPTGGITSQQTTYTHTLTLGSGTFKQVIFAQYADDERVEFSYAGLGGVGGPTDSNDYYAIVSVTDFPVSRLLNELELQFRFSEIVTSYPFTLSPRIFALQIKYKLLRGTYTETYYGEENILGALRGLVKSSPDADNFDFLIAMERVNYEMNEGFVKTPAEVINDYPDKLIHLINLVLEQKVILSDIKLQNLFVKCSDNNNVSCQLGVLDLDKEFVADLTGWYPGWYPLDRLISKLTGGITIELARQYMVLMVCFVGLNNELYLKTKSKLLRDVGLLSASGEFNVYALNQMLQHEQLNKQIRHYLGFNHDRTRDIAKGFMDEYILAKEKPRDGLPDPDSMLTDDSSLDGGKSRKKHKKTRKRKPKSKKTRRKRSLLNRAKAWGK